MLAVQLGIVLDLGLVSGDLAVFEFFEIAPPGLAAQEALSGFCPFFERSNPEGHPSG